MTLHVAVLDPAGNITLLVTTPVDSKCHAAVARTLLALPELGGEQVGFLVPPVCGGQVRLAMMGGEFCGNALRSTGYYYALKSGRRGRVSVATEIAGTDGPILVEADLETGMAKAKMPLPLTVCDIEIAKRPVRAVVSEGITHFILYEKQPDEAFVREAAEYADRTFGSEAVGVMFFDPMLRFMRPAVYVRATDSLVYESSCASGSTAAAVAEAYASPDGGYSYDIRQPGGVIRVELKKKDGRIESLHIGGCVALMREVTVDVGCV